MKILHLVSSAEPGGAQKLAVQLAKSARDAGHDARVLFLYDRKGNIGLYRHESLFVQLLSKQFRPGLRYPINFLLAQLELARYVKVFNPDVVHTHLFEAKIVAATNLRIRSHVIVDTVHDNLPWWGRPGLKNKLKTRFDGHYARNVAKKSVAISVAVKKDMLTNVNLQGQVPDLIRNGISFSRMPDEYACDDPDRLRVLLCGRLQVRKKGLDTAIEVIEGLYALYPTLAVDVVGDGDDADEFKVLIKHYGLADVVTMHGWVEDPTNCMRKASVLLMPSRWEGFGLVAAESQALGLPVVASRVGGLCEVVDDGVTGYLCDPEKSKEFIEAVSELADNSELANSMSIAARERAVEEFSISSCSQRYLDVYKNIVAKC